MARTTQTTKPTLWWQKPFAESYQHYVNKEGLTAVESISLDEFLTGLAFATGKEWQPGNCRAIPDYTNVAEHICKLSGAQAYFTPPVAKRFAHSHFFWMMERRANGEKVILDPTGVPLEFGLCEPESIVPYFGILEYAPKNHKRVYDLMEDMDGWETRSLPPGFRP